MIDLMIYFRLNLFNKFPHIFFMQQQSLYNFQEIICKPLIQVDLKVLSGIRSCQGFPESIAASLCNPRTAPMKKKDLYLKNSRHLLFKSDKDFFQEPESFQTFTQIFEALICDFVESTSKSATFYEKKWFTQQK